MTATPDASVPRLVMIDDTDPSIKYNPPSAFSLDSSGKMDQAGFGGPVWNKTITGTTTNASFSYTFRGTFVRAMVAGQGAPYGWNCTVDDHAISAFMIDSTQMTNLIACDSAGTLSSSTGEHTLDMNIWFTSESPSNSTVWLDSIQYAPLASDKLDEVMLRVHNSDPTVSYSNSSGGWTYQGYGANGTQRTGTSMNYEFNGTSASLYTINFGTPTKFNANTAFYALDGDSSTNFDIPGSASVANTPSGNFSNILNWPLFTTPTLPPAEHNIQVATAFNASTSPQYLLIDYFVIKTNPANATTGEGASPVSTSASASSAASNRGGSSSNIVGPVVGGVVGGLVALAAIALIFLFLRKRRKDRQSGGMLDLGPGPNFGSSGYGGYFPLVPSSGSGGGNSEVTPFLYSDGPSDAAVPQKYAEAGSYYSDQNAMVSPAAGSSSGQSAGSSNRNQYDRSSEGFDPNRLVSMKNAQSLSLRDQELRRTELRMHTDSGVRLPPPGEREIVDVPPTYTES